MQSRSLILAAGLCGAVGVALAAVAAHGDAPNAQTASTFLLVHAAAFLSAGLIAFNPPLRWAAGVLVAGVVLFSADLVSRDFTDSRLFSMAAPAGGFLMIIGWLGVGISAFLPRRLL